MEYIQKDFRIFVTFALIGVKNYLLNNLIIIENIIYLAFAFVLR